MAGFRTRVHCVQLLQGWVHPLHGYADGFQQGTVSSGGGQSPENLGHWWGGVSPGHGLALATGQAHRLRGMPASTSTATGGGRGSRKFSRHPARARAVPHERNFSLVSSAQAKKNPAQWPGCNPAMCAGPLREVKRGALPLGCDHTGPPANGWAHQHPAEVRQPARPRATDRHTGTHFVIGYKFSRLKAGPPAPSTPTGRAFGLRAGAGAGHQEQHAHGTGHLPTGTSASHSTHMARPPGRPLAQGSGVRLVEREGFTARG